MASVLIIGSNSTLAKSLIIKFKENNYSVITTNRNDKEIGNNSFNLDLSKDPSSWELPKTRIDIAIICSAITSIEYCEKFPEESYKINVVATKKLINILIKRKIFVIFPSTSLVFDNKTILPKTTDTLNPRINYGKQKAEVENMILELKSSYIVIVRLSKVVENVYLLFENWCKELNANKIIHPFDDLYFAPISIEFFYKAIITIYDKRLTGIFHLSAYDAITYYDSINYLAKKLKFNMQLIKPVSCITKGIEYNSKHIALDTTKLTELGLTSPSSLKVMEEVLIYIDKNLK